MPRHANLTSKCRGVLLAVIACLAHVTPTFAQSVPIGWQVQGNEAWFNNCPGNCGAGCQAVPNVCGGSQYWQAEILTVAEEVDPSSSWYEDICPTGTRWLRVRVSWTRARANWRYVGLTSDGCQHHDSICRASWSNQYACWLTAPSGAVCTGSGTQVWGPHEDWIYGYFYYDYQWLSGTSCSIPPARSQSTEGDTTGTLLWKNEKRWLVAPPRAPNENSGTIVPFKAPM